jgi:excisionase family DNA binding protein
MTVETQLLTATQVAAVLSISKRQVWRLADSGILPGKVHVGRLARWRKDAIDKWIAAGCPNKTR